MLENRQKLRKKEINLIPLVNIIFLLLTFFIVAGSIEKIEPFPLSLPNGMQEHYTSNKKLSTIYLHKDGRIAVNNDIVEKDDFKTIINTLLLENKNKELLIKSDADVSSQNLISVIRTIEELGGTDISIITKIMQNNAR